jgi:uroporphyrinogen decarboxylase
MPASLTHQERVNRMFARKDHDRVPRFESCWNDTLDRWMREGLGGSDRGEAMAEVHRLLDSDLHFLCWYWPHPFPGGGVVLEEDEETYVRKSESGTIERYWKHKSGTPEHLGWECDNRETWEKRYKPAFIEQPIQVDPKQVAEAYAQGVAEKKWTYLSGVSVFEILRKVLGDEAFMIQLVDDPEWIEDIARTATDNLLRNFEVLLDTGIRPDGVWIYDDMAFNTMTFCSPGMYRELLWPQHKRVADFAHAHRMKLIFHSDGDLRGVIPHFLDAGFDCLQPLEAKASMDIRKLVPEVGDQLAFFGNIDIMKMISNDLDVIEEELTAKLTAGMSGKGYVYHSDHSIPPQVSFQTFKDIIRLLAKHGNYAG